MYWSNVCSPLDPDGASGLSRVHKQDRVWLRRKNLRPRASPTPNRQRLAAEEGARAMADVERSAATIRKNMDRLRALRQAKEAEDAAHAAANPQPEVTKPAKKKVKRIVK